MGVGKLRLKNSVAQNAILYIFFFFFSLLFFFLHSTYKMASNIEPVAIPEEANEEQIYNDMIKQLAAKAPEPYGAIPPLIKKKRKQRKKKQTQEPVRRMSHVENWLAVDSRESIPDEEDLVSIIFFFLCKNSRPCCYFLKHAILRYIHLFVISCQRTTWCYHYICRHLLLALR